VNIGFYFMRSNVRTRRFLRQLQSYHGSNRGRIFDQIEFDELLGNLNTPPASTQGGVAGGSAHATVPDAYPQDVQELRWRKLDYNSSSLPIHPLLSLSLPTPPSLPPSPSPPLLLLHLQSQVAEAGLLYCTLYHMHSCTTHHSLHTTHYTPLTTHHSLHTTHYTPLASGGGSWTITSLVGGTAWTTGTHSIHTHCTLTAHSLHTHCTLTTHSRRGLQVHTHYTLTTHSMHTHCTLTTHPLLCTA
jgi:hypothetical protein